MIPRWNAWIRWPTCSTRTNAPLLRQTRLTDAALVARFAAQEPRVALAAIGSARLPEQAWLDLIPTLPVQARGFLRHRRDLGANVEALLARLGIDDFGLPQPDGYHALPAAPAQTSESGAWPIDEAADERIAVLTPAARTPPSPETDGQPGRNEGIGAIVRRIEAFRRNRDAAAGPADPTAPHLPFSDEARATAPPASPLSTCAAMPRAGSSRRGCKRAPGLARCWWAFVRSRPNRARRRAATPPPSARRKSMCRSSRGGWN
jgi:hypothetical protein